MEYDLLLRFVECLLHLSIGRGLNGKKAISIERGIVFEVIIRLLGLGVPVRRGRSMID